MTIQIHDPDVVAVQIRRYKVTIATTLVTLQSWQPCYTDWESVGREVVGETMKTLRHLEGGLAQLRTFLRMHGWPSPPSPLPPMRSVWNLLGDACEASFEAAIAVRSYLPMSASLEEMAFRKLLNARNRMSELEHSVLLFLEEVEQFYPGLSVDDYRTLLLEISETLFTEQSLQDLAQDETRVLKLKSSLCTVLKWMRTVEGKDEETQSLTAAFDGKEVEIVKNAIENALLHVYVTLDVQALERQARINERINELATWRIQAYSMRQRVPEMDR